MWVHSCVITLTDVSYSFFSVTPVRQLFNRDTTAIFYRCSDGCLPHVCGQVLVFRGKNTFLVGKCCFYYKFNINCNMTNANVKVPQYNLFCNNEISFSCNAR